VTTLAEILLLLIAFANVKAFMVDGMAGVTEWWRLKLVGS
jgi:hypothetical protein